MMFHNVHSHMSDEPEETILYQDAQKNIHFAIKEQQVFGVFDVAANIVLAKFKDSLSLSLRIHLEQIDRTLVMELNNNNIFCAWRMWELLLGWDNPITASAMIASEAAVDRYGSASEKWNEIFRESSVTAVMAMPLPTGLLETAIRQVADEVMSPWMITDEIKAGIIEWQEPFQPLGILQPSEAEAILALQAVRLKPYLKHIKAFAEDPLGLGMLESEHAMRMIRDRLSHVLERMPQEQPFRIFAVAATICNMQVYMSPMMQGRAVLELAASAASDWTADHFERQGLHLNGRIHGRDLKNFCKIRAHTIKDMPVVTRLIYGPVQ